MIALAGVLIVLGCTVVGLITSFYKAVLWGVVALVLLGWLGWWSIIPLGLLLLGALHEHGKKVAA